MLQAQSAKGKMLTKNWPRVRLYDLQSWWWWPTTSQLSLTDVCAWIRTSQMFNQERGFFSFRADCYATPITALSLSFPPSLPPSPSLHHKIRENWIRGQLQLFGQKTAPTEPSQLTQSSLIPFGFRPLRTIRTKHEWMRVLVFLFSALPPSFFVTLTTEAEWRGVSAGEHTKRHSGNTRNSLPDISMKTTKLLPAWFTTLSQNGLKGGLFLFQVKIFQKQGALR